MPTYQQSLGQYGESLAAEALAKRGYTIITQNWHCPQGEIDLVAHDGDEWVFVEVRTRRSADTNTAIESITPRKQANMIAAAQAYLDSQELEDVAWRIDLVVIALRPDGPLLEVITNAVGW
jgi:putative endonuclease